MNYAYRPSIVLNLQLGCQAALILSAREEDRAREPFQQSEGTGEEQKGTVQEEERVGHLIQAGRFIRFAHCLVN